jgi:uncharacterized membrane protein YraQ (UPF0718 family)
VVRPSVVTRLREGFMYAFGGLIGDIGGWLLIGIGIAAVISFAIPPHFFEQYAKNEFFSLLAMLLLGIPLYVCATASTPIAAALVLKGLSPGAALVFLLAGPATNATTITVVTRLMGRRIAFLYVATIALCSLLMGWVVNQIYTTLQISTHQWVHTVTESTGNPAGAIASILLLVLILRSIMPRWESKKGGCGCEKPVV